MVEDGEIRSGEKACLERREGGVVFDCFTADRLALEPNIQIVMRWGSCYYSR